MTDVKFNCGGGACGVMVIVRRNGDDDASSKPGRG